MQAGVDAVQIFDTWAGVLPPDEFRRWCIAPAKRIVAGVRARVPDAKIIGFPRGAGTMLPDYLDEAALDAVSLDWMIDKKFAREEIQSRLPVQGNLDPLALLAGGAALDAEIERCSRLLPATPSSQSRPRHSRPDGMSSRCQARPG